MKSLLNKDFPQFEKYYDQLDKLANLVEQKSKEINITAIREYEKILEKHILDSLMCSKISLVEERLAKSEVLDLGTGGGFPGLPLAITHPNSNFVLLDSTRKKLDVVKEFAKDLGLSNVKTVWGRAEEVSKEKASKFDVVVSRAVAFLPELITLCKPFIKKNGLIVLYKQIDKAELEAGDIAAKNSGLKLIEEFEYHLSDSARNILIYAAT
jgi:16S rRNA (guanine527-N7)-methyltransferase